MRALRSTTLPAAAAALAACPDPSPLAEAPGAALVHADARYPYNATR